jgi:hypothetical protein
MDYFEINRISNSDLSRFKSEIILGETYQRPEKATNFGKVFHGLLLEPHLPIETYPGIDYRLIDRLINKVKEDMFCSGYLTNGLKEELVLFTDSTTQAKCKAKLDIKFRNTRSNTITILDFKTTYARNYAQFVGSLTSYDYDRQAAFYMDSVHAQRFILIGVQKIKPYDLFYFEANKAFGFVDYGRKKYKALLKKYVAHYNLSAHNFYKHSA